MKTKTQLAQDYLLDIIMSSEVGRKIPSERDLVAHLGFSRPIIQRAISNLMAEGYLRKEERLGTYVMNKTIYTGLNSFTSFEDTAKELGMQPITKVLEHSVLYADTHLANKMECQVGDKVHYFLRLRQHADTPVMLDYQYFLDFAVAGISNRYLEHSVYKYIETVMQLSIGSATSIIDAVRPEPEIAELLQLDISEPLLQVDRLSRLSDGRVFEHTISFAASSRHKLLVQSTR
ncbi:MAG: GntR family transcriptional regulator [Ruminococcaceae bacterium]|nr:GntR family transcriptional regulator [Oscillospiraceae bacterium]